jgi:mono/diheme cytochrome c family protein
LRAHRGLQQPHRLSTWHVRVLLLITGSTLLTVAAAAAALGAKGTHPAPASAKLEGQKLYRKYCGQCHALKAARAVGFGTGKKKGFGEDGGPSFDTLRVPYNLSVQAVMVPWAGHEIISHKMTWSQVKEVADYVATVTRAHKRLAQPIDG